MSAFRKCLWKRRQTAISLLLYIQFMNNIKERKVSKRHDLYVTIIPTTNSHPTDVVHYLDTGVVFHSLLTLGSDRMIYCQDIKSSYCVGSSFILSLLLVPGLQVSVIAFLCLLCLHWHLSSSPCFSSPG